MRGRQLCGTSGIGGFDLGMKFREHADKLGVEFTKDTVLKLRPRTLRDENEVLEAAEAGAGHPPVIRQVVGKGDETRESGHYRFRCPTRKLGILGRQSLREKAFPTVRPATARSSGKR